MSKIKVQDFPKNSFSIIIADIVKIKVAEEV